MAITPQYREWNLDDVSQIQKVLYNTWVASYSEFIPMLDIQWYFNNHYSEFDFAQMNDDPDTWSFVAEVKGHIVGYARCKSRPSEERFYLESLYILPEFQGNGIGRVLMKMAEDKGVSLGYDRVWLGVMVQNTSSLQWYKKLGFQFVEEAPFAMGNTVVVHLIGYREIQHHA